VRDLERSRFPAIKGLSVERFGRQSDYVQNHDMAIAMKDLLEALSFPKNDLPPNPVGASSPDARAQRWPWKGIEVWF
jgi:hypothetical protein